VGQPVVSLTCPVLDVNGHGDNRGAGEQLQLVVHWTRNGALVDDGDGKKKLILIFILVLLIYNYFIYIFFLF
jgi:hypothetical protein